MPNSSVRWTVKKNNAASWSSDLRKALGDVVQSFAQQVLILAQETVVVRTGATQQSGSVVGSGMTAQVTFGGAALYLEFGTAHMPAQPFLSTAVAELAQGFYSQIELVSGGRMTGYGNVGNVIGSSDFYA